MNRVRLKEGIRKEKRIKHLTLSPEERFRAIAHLIIDRILDEQLNGNLNKLLISKKP